MKKKLILLIGVVAMLGLSGCGSKVLNISSKDGNLQQSIVVNDIGENETAEQEVADNSSSDTMYIYSEYDTIKDYDTVDELLGDANALVKVEVVQANSENVRSYIYTSYDMKVLGVVYGTIGVEGDIINVNMPGGTLQGEEAQEMLSEVTEGKDAGDLSGVNQIVSDGDTDRLLSVGDEAYLFIMRESETSFAVVGEYRGEMLLENGVVNFDNNIIGFEEGISVYGLENGRMAESEFVEAINDLVEDN